MLYVIILSAAVDLVPSNIPKAIVLLADIFPAFVAKLVAPYFIHLIPYGSRMFLCAGLSACGMLLVAYTPDVEVKMLGIGIASLSSGLGELTFLGLTHYYGRMSLAGFSSGTGGAGLIGAGTYALATTTFGLSSRATITASAVLPAVIVICYYFVLPRHDALAGYQVISHPSTSSSNPDEIEETQRMLDDVPESPLTQPDVHAPRRSRSSSSAISHHYIRTNITANLRRARKLLIP